MRETVLVKWFQEMRWSVWVLIQIIASIVLLCLICKYSFSHLELYFRQSFWLRVVIFTIQYSTVQYNTLHHITTAGRLHRASKNSQFAKIIMRRPYRMESGPCSSVSITTGYGLDGPEIRIPLGGGGEIFRTCPDRPWDPPINEWAPQ